MSLEEPGVEEPQRRDTHYFVDTVFPKDLWMLIAPYLHWMGVAGLRLQCKKLARWLKEAPLLAGALKSLNSLHGAVGLDSGMTTSGPYAPISRRNSHGHYNVNFGIYNKRAMERGSRAKLLASNVIEIYWPGKPLRRLELPRFSTVPIPAREWKIKVAWRSIMLHLRYHMVYYASLSREWPCKQGDDEGLIGAVDARLGFPLVAYAWPWARKFRDTGDATMDAESPVIWDMERWDIALGVDHYSDPRAFKLVAETEDGPYGHMFEFMQNPTFQQGNLVTSSQVRALPDMKSALDRIESERPAYEASLRERRDAKLEYKVEGIERELARLDTAEEARTLAGGAAMKRRKIALVEECVN